MDLLSEKVNLLNLPPKEVLDLILLRRQYRSYREDRTVTIETSELPPESQNCIKCQRAVFSSDETDNPFIPFCANGIDLSTVPDSFIFQSNDCPDFQPERNSQ